MPLLRRMWVFNYFKLMIKKNTVTPLSVTDSTRSSTDLRKSTTLLMTPVTSATERPKTWRNRLYLDINIGSYMMKNMKELRSSEFHRKVMDCIRHINYSVDVAIASTIFFEIADTTPEEQFKKFRVTMNKFGLRVYKKYENEFIESDLFWACFLNSSLTTKLDTKKIFSSKNDSVSTFDIRYLIYQYVVREETAGGKKGSNYLNFTKSLKHALKWHKEAINLEKAFWEGLSLARELPNSVLLKRTHNLFTKISEADKNASDTYSKLMKNYSHNPLLLRYYGLYLLHIRGEEFIAEDMFNWADDIEDAQDVEENEDDSNEVEKLAKRNEENENGYSLNDLIQQQKHDFRIKLPTLNEESEKEGRYNGAGVLKKEKSDDCGLDDDIENNEANFGDCDIDEDDGYYIYPSYTVLPAPNQELAKQDKFKIVIDEEEEKKEEDKNEETKPNKFAIALDDNDKKDKNEETKPNKFVISLDNNNNKEREESKPNKFAITLDDNDKKEDKKEGETEKKKSEEVSNNEVTKFDGTKEDKKENNPLNTTKIIVSPLAATTSTATVPGTSISLAESPKSKIKSSNSDDTIDLNKSSSNEENKSDKKTPDSENSQTMVVSPLQFNNLSPNNDNNIETNNSSSINNVFTFPNDTKIQKDASVHLKPKFAIDLNPVTLIVNSADDERNTQVFAKPKFAIQLDDIDEENESKNGDNNKRSKRSKMSKLSKCSGKSKCTARSNMRRSRRKHSVNSIMSSKNRPSDIVEEINKLNAEQGSDNSDECANGLGILALERFSLFFVIFIAVMGIIVPGLIIILLLCVTNSGQTLLNIQVKHLYHIWISSIESRDLIFHPNSITSTTLNYLKNDIEMCEKYQVLIMSCKSKSSFSKYSCSQLPKFTSLKTTHIMYLDNYRNYSSQVPIIQAYNEYIYSFQTLLAKIQHTYNTPFNDLDYEFITNNSYSILPDLIVPLETYAESLKENTQIFTIIILVFIFLNVFILLICAYFLRRNIGLAHKEQHLGLDTLKLIPVAECTRITEKFVGLIRNFNVNVNDEDNGKNMVDTFHNLEDDYYNDSDEDQYNINKDYKPSLTDKKDDENNDGSKYYGDSTCKILIDKKVQQQFKEMEKNSYNCLTRKKYTYLVLIYFFLEFVTVTVALVLLLISIISFKGRINELEILSKTIHDMGNIYYKAGDLIIHKDDSVLYNKIRTEMSEGIHDMIKNYDCLIYGCDNTDTKGISQLNDDILNLYFYDYDDNQNTYDSAIMKFERAASLFIAESKDDLNVNNVQYQIMCLLFKNRLMSEKFERAINYFEDLRNNSFVTSLVLIICVFVVLFIVNILGYKYILTFFSRTFLRDVMLVRFLLTNVGSKVKNKVPVIVMYLEKTKWVNSRKETAEIEDDIVF